MQFIFLIILVINLLVLPHSAFAITRTPGPTGSGKLPAPTSPSGGNPPNPGNNPPNPPGGALAPLQSWYAPDGSACNLTNYITYFNQTNCTGQAGFVTQGISPQSPCSTNGQGKCFQVKGLPFILPAKSSWDLNSQSCVPVTPAAIPGNAFDTLYNCRFGILPGSEVKGTITVNFGNHQQFDKIFVWLTDTKDNFSRSIELVKNQLVANQPYQYSFPNLFADKKYDIWVKAYGPGGVYLENISYESSCSLPSCRVIPSAQIDFKLTFPNLAGSIGNVNQGKGIRPGNPNIPGRQAGIQISNDDFQRMIDQWISGQINPVGMSLFIKQLSRVPGLQKAICDPKIPGGCSL